MRNFERMVEGIGFYTESGNLATLPSFDECVEMVREAAYQKWQQAGSAPGQAMDFWLEAERELFPHAAPGTYQTYVCDLSLPENHGYLRYWDEVGITPQGPSRK